MELIKMERIEDDGLVRNSTEPLTPFRLILRAPNPCTSYIDVTQNKS